MDALSDYKEWWEIQLSLQESKYREIINKAKIKLEKKRDLFPQEVLVKINEETNKCKNSDLRMSIIMIKFISGLSVHQESLTELMQADKNAAQMIFQEKLVALEKILEEIK
ncbi:MAG: hypothetical protein MUF50_03385 [Planctomycetes bacterium]|jgi:hypothetical protein|nr:hypothetical protein [Planctomycetota bacterium]